MKKRKELQIEDKMILRLVLDDKERDKADSSEYRDNLIKYDKLIRAIEEDPGPDRDFNVQVPLTRIAIKNLKSRIMQLLLKRRTFRPTEETDVETVQLNEDFFDWYSNSYQKNRFEFLDQGVSALMGKGTVISTGTWVKNTEKVVDYQYYPIMKDQQVDIGGQVQTVQAELTQDDIIRDLLPEEDDRIRITDVTDIGEDHVRVKYQEHIDNKTDSDQWEDRIMELDFSIDEAKMEIVARIEKIETMFEGVENRIRSIDNISFPVDADDLQTSDHVNIEFTTTVSELLRKRDQGIYQFDDEQLDRIKGVSVHARKVQPGGVVAEEKKNEGGSGDDLPENSMTVNGVESYYLWDVEGKGYLEQVIFTVIPDANIIVRKQYLNEVFRHGKRPLQCGVWDIREQRLLGMGVAEEMAPLQKLINDCFNVILNATGWALNPAGFINATATADNKPISYKRGEIISINGDPPQFVPYPANFPVEFQVISFLIDIFQRQTASSDQTQGKAGNVKTATATVKLLQESYQNMNLNIQRVVRWVQQVDRHTWQLIRAYMPEEMTFRVMGAGHEWEFKKMSRKDLLMNPDIALEVNVEETSKEYLQQVAQELLAAVLHPILIQSGITTPKKIYEAVKNLLSSFGIKDYTKYIKEPPEIESMDPNKENTLMMEGKVVVTQPTDDDQEHMQSHMAFRKTIPHITETENVDNLLRMDDAHIMLHQQQQQMKLLQQQQMAQMASMMPQKQQGGGNGDELQGKVAGPQNPTQNNMFGQMAMPGMGTV